MTLNRGDRVDVVLDVVREGDVWRVRMMGVLLPDQPSPPPPTGEHDRNRVQTFLGQEHLVRAFSIPANDAPEAPDAT